MARRSSFLVKSPRRRSRPDRVTPTRLGLPKMPRNWSRLGHLAVPRGLLANLPTCDQAVGAVAWLINPPRSCPEILDIAVGIENFCSWPAHFKTHDVERHGNLQIMARRHPSLPAC